MLPFTLDTALTIALAAHHGQKDMGGQPYILHPLRVMGKQNSMPCMMAAALHDVVEDSPTTLDDLRKVHCPEMVVEAVDCLTRRSGEDYMAMIHRIKLNDIATPVKIADLEDNMNIQRILGRREGLGEKDMKRLQKYLNAWTYLTGK